MRTLLGMLSSGRLTHVPNSFHAVNLPASVYAGKLLSQSSRLGSRSCFSMPEASMVSKAQDTRDVAPTMQDLRTVAAWRLALLREYSSTLSGCQTDFNTAVQLKGVTFNNRQVWLQYSS